MGIRFTDEKNRAALTRATQAGSLRRVSRGVYTDDLDLTAEQVVERYRWDLLAHFVPDAVVVDRSAARGGAPIDGVLFVASETRATDVTLPGLVIAVRPGKRLPSDMPLRHEIALASTARTLVDNLALARGRTRVARTLSRAELGDWVARQAGLLGPERLNRVRDEAKLIAEQLGVPERVQQVDALVSAAWGTGAVPSESKALAARSVGLGFDQDRLRAFDAVSASLAALRPDDEVPSSIEADEPPETSQGFWEAYFSNYIEGTVFEVAEARQIVDTGQPPADRPADGHDILGMYRVVTDPATRGRVADDPDQLRTLVKAFHSEILAGRPETLPGEFKQSANQASGYRFVEPDLVEGTLLEGFGFRQRLDNPFARALYMFYLVSEVHPFTDGNGRVARAVMNAELTAAGQSRIVIPIVWRNEYLTSVRELSRNARCDLYVRTLGFAWRWTAAMNWVDPPMTELQLEQTNALLDSTEAAGSGQRLLMPGSG
jgi:Fic/DOC family